MTSLFSSRGSKLPINNKKANARRDGKALRSSVGDVSRPDVADFSEEAFSKRFQRGHDGLYSGSHHTKSDAIITEGADFAEDTVVDQESLMIKITPDMKALHRHLGNHVESAVAGGFSVQQVRALRKVFSNRTNQNAAQVLEKLDKQKALSPADRTAKMKAHQLMQVAATEITKICRAS